MIKLIYAYCIGLLMIPSSLFGGDARIKNEQELRIKLIYYDEEVITSSETVVRTDTTTIKDLYKYARKITGADDVSLNIYGLQKKRDDFEAEEYIEILFDSDDSIQKNITGNGNIFPKSKDNVPCCVIALSPVDMADVRRVCSSAELLYGKASEKPALQKNGTVTDYYGDYSGDYYDEPIRVSNVPPEECIKVFHGPDLISSGIPRGKFCVMAVALGCFSYWTLHQGPQKRRKKHTETQERSAGNDTIKEQVIEGDFSQDLPVSTTDE
jgi:hypothetical protein